MRRFILLFFVILLGTVTSGIGAESNSGVQEVVRLARAGMGEEVLLALVQNSYLNYDITTDEIQMLNDLGVSEKVIAAIMTRGKVIRGQEVSDAEGSPGTDFPQPTNEAPKDQVGEDRDDQDQQEERVLTSAPPPVHPKSTATVAYFYDSLSPYGNWINVGEVGWCWQPNVVVLDAQWRPYRDRGRWIWTDAGWYWQSGYSWGWSAFHYGRWHYDLRHRWVWRPDTVWGPAWVHWRSNDSYVGWAPLPPRARFGLGVGFSWQGKNVGVDFSFGLGHRDYVFVGSGSFLHANLRPVCVPPIRVHNVYKETTIIKNTYITKNKTVINQGVSVEKIGRATKREIRALRLADRQIKPGHPVTGSRPNKDTMPVYRPKFDKKSPTSTPHKISEKRREALEDRRERIEERRTNQLKPVFPRTPETPRAQGNQKKAEGDGRPKKVPQEPRRPIKTEESVKTRAPRIPGTVKEQESSTEETKSERGGKRKSR